MSENGFVVVYPKRKAPFESLLLREKPFLLSYQQKAKLCCNMTIYENACFCLYFNLYHFMPVGYLSLSDAEFDISKPP